jgi:hypothetical protein
MAGAGCLFDAPLRFKTKSSQINIMNFKLSLHSSFQNMSLHLQSLPVPSVLPGNHIVIYITSFSFTPLWSLSGKPISPVISFPMNWFQHSAESWKSTLPNHPALFASQENCYNMYDIDDICGCAFDLRVITGIIQWLRICEQPTIAMICRSARVRSNLSSVHWENR